MFSRRASGANPDYQLCLNWCTDSSNYSHRWRGATAFPKKTIRTAGAVLLHSHAGAWEREKKLVR
jgi:hypothetical protein